MEGFPLQPAQKRKPLFQFKTSRQPEKENTCSNTLFPRARNSSILSLKDVSISSRVHYDSDKEGTSNSGSVNDSANGNASSKDDGPVFGSKEWLLQELIKVDDEIEKLYERRESLMNALDIISKRSSSEEDEEDLLEAHEPRLSYFRSLSDKEEENVFDVPAEPLNDDYDDADMSLVKSLTDLPTETTLLELVAPSDLLITASPSSFSLLDTGSYRVLKTIPANVSCLKYHNSMLYVGTEDKKIKIYNVPPVSYTHISFYSNDLYVSTLSGHYGAVTAIDCSGEKIVSLGEDNTVRVWNMDIQENVFTLPSLKTPDNYLKQKYSLFKSSIINLPSTYDIVGSTQKKGLADIRRVDRSKGLQLTSDGQGIAVTHLDAVRFFDLRMNVCRRTIEVDSVYDVHFDDSFNLMTVSTNSVKLFDIRTSKVVSEWNGKITCGTLAKDGKVIYGDGCQVKINDDVLETHPSQITGVACVGKRLATSSRALVNLWDI
ncbi:hypothetical protein MP638_004916 [Amoeboaphelidium occidentale]|nr:hypothetical protein MP638_004916 [Amoeboaphelidium occidentale]